MGPVSPRPNRVDFWEVKLNSHMQKNANDSKRLHFPKRKRCWTTSRSFWPLQKSQIRHRFLKNNIDAEWRDVESSASEGSLSFKVFKFFCNITWKTATNTHPVVVFKFKLKTLTNYTSIPLHTLQNNYIIIIWFVYFLKVNPSMYLSHLWAQGCMI